MNNENYENILIPQLIFIWNKQIQLQLSGHNQLLLGTFPVFIDTCIPATETKGSFIETNPVDKNMLNRLWERRAEVPFYVTYVATQKFFPLRVQFFLRNNMINPLVMNVVNKVNNEII